MKVVILAGGFGTRISEESRLKPKPMIEIGEMPVLWHIMKGYACYGFREFIICAGYKQHIIKDWFSNYFLYSSDVRFQYNSGAADMKVLHSTAEPWDVIVADTGLHTMTGGRVLRIRDYVGNEPFMLTYGDAVCDVNIEKLLEFHRLHGKIVTLTAVIQEQRKGVLEIGKYGAVRSFREKKSSDGTPINAGFMVMESGVFDYLRDDETILETDVLERLADDGQLMSYIHHGFWQCMDSQRERMILENLWASGKAPWKLW